MGSISHHITPLVIDSLGGGHTHTEVRGRKQFYETRRAWFNNHSVMNEMNGLCFDSYTEANNKGVVFCLRFLLLSTLTLCIIGEYNSSLLQHVNSMYEVMITF